MKKKATLCILLSLLLVFGFVFVGCGDDPATDAPAPDDAPDDAPDADAEPAADVPDDWPGTVTLGTAGVGGVYFVYGGGIGSMIDDIVGVPTGVEQTGGPADNMMLVHDGAIELGMITMGIGYEGWNALEGTAFEGEEHDNVRALFPMYSTYSQWWAHADSGITTLRDLDGKQVGVGPTGGTPGTYHPQILEALGVDASPVWGATGDLVESHADRQIDANSQATGLPMGGLLSYEATVGADNVVMLPIEGDDRDEVIEAMPFWVPGTIPADTYDFLDDDLETVVVFNWFIGHKDLPDSLIYEIVDAVMTNNDRVVSIHEAGRETVPENVGTNDFLPLHPGAAQWFEDNGYDVPAGAQPID